MTKKQIKRFLEKTLRTDLKHFPCLAILGPRQCGKSFLALHLIKELKNAVYIDAEKPAHLKRISEPELFFELHKKNLICIDEVHRIPEIFAVLRSTIDERNRNGQFLLLGSASPDLLKQSSETLAGRISYYELSPFLLPETYPAPAISQNQINKYWLRGGFPRSFLATDDVLSFKWRKNFIKTFLEKDIPQLGFNIPAPTLLRLWQMCAHHHGQMLNMQQIGEAMGLSHTTIRHYLELLTKTFVIRLLPPFHANYGKRLVKTPKIFIRDTGLLHALLNIETMDDLLSHPVCGYSWEEMIIENIIFFMSGWEPYFYRTATGVEIDLLLVKGRKKIAVECKLSSAPEIPKGFWLALEDVKPDETWVIAPVSESYPLKKNVTVASLPEFLKAH